MCPTVRTPGDFCLPDYIGIIPVNQVDISVCHKKNHRIIIRRVKYADGRNEKIIMCKSLLTYANQCASSYRRKPLSAPQNLYKLLQYIAVSRWVEESKNICKIMPIWERLLLIVRFVLLLCCVTTGVVCRNMPLSAFGNPSTTPVLPTNLSPQTADIFKELEQ